MTDRTSRTNITEALYEALAIALSVQLHEAADPACSGQPPYSETQAQAESIAALVMRSPVVANALAAEPRSDAVTARDEPSLTERLCRHIESVEKSYLGGPTVRGAELVREARAASASVPPLDFDALDGAIANAYDAYGTAGVIREYARLTAAETPEQDDA